MLVVVLSLVVVLIGGGAWYYSWCGGTGDGQTPVSVRVPEGTTGEGVIEILHGAGVIRCGGVLGRVRLQETELADEIRAGRYELMTNMPLESALAVLTTPPKVVKTLTTTVPEGYRITQIAETVSDELGLSGPRFAQRAESGSFALPPYLLEGTPTTEGFLFPKTYEFASRGLTEDVVIDRMLEQFSTEVGGLPWRRATRLDVSPYEVVTIASMIEREASIASERPLIAAVIYNRLRVGEILGIDATLQYIDPDPSDGLTESDLAIESPYNTRLHEGLPPTPIANPGLASIRAALRPADSDVRYYVLCGEDGSHEFTDDYDQFLADKQRCLG